MAEEKGVSQNGLLSPWHALLKKSQNKFSLYTPSSSGGLVNCECISTWTLLIDIVSSLQVEVRNPKPHVKKIVETRYTTIRYPVFITQVIKPLLTQVETKVRPLFFTKTINRYTTVKFTVTGIGQVTHTTVKFEKEYITRCNKKGYDHHRRDATDGPEVDVEADKPSVPTYRTSSIEAPPGVPYDDVPLQPSDDGHASGVKPTPVQTDEVTAATVPPVSYRRPGHFRRPPPPPPPRPVGPPRNLGFYGALAQLGLAGSQQSTRTEPYRPHPPLLRSPAVVIG